MDYAAEVAIAELTDRLDRAILSVEKLAERSASDLSLMRVNELFRLQGKIEGLELALRYVKEMI